MLKINLLPPRVKAARVKRLMALGAIAGAAIVLAIPAGLWYLKFMTVLSIESQIRAVDREAAEYAGVIEKVTALEAQEAALAKKIDVMNKLVAKQATWIRVLEAISFAQARSRDLWLSSFVTRAVAGGVDAGRTELTLAGFAFSVASVDEFVRTFMKSEFAPSMEKQPTSSPSTSEGQAIVTFTVTFRFKV